MGCRGENMFLVSIITICLNEEKTIEETLQSVLQQTYLNVEYVIKDGGSNDNTNEIIKKTIHKYPQKKIKHIVRKDKGIYDAMNQAVEVCSGEWINFMNSGDKFYNKNVIKKIFNNFEYSEYGVLYGDAIVKEEGIEAIWEANINRISKSMPFCHQSCFIKKELMLRYPFNTELKIAADYNNILDLYINSISFYNIKMCISIFQMNGLSSTNFVQRYKEKKRVQFEHGIGNNSKLVYGFELFFEKIKSYIINNFPKKLLRNLKRIYIIKKYVRKENVKKNKNEKN